MDSLPATGTHPICCQQTWTLENFAHLLLLDPKAASRMTCESTRFDTNVGQLSDRLQFTLQLVPVYEDPYNAGSRYVSLYLHLLPSNGFAFVKQRVDYRFVIVGPDGKDGYVKEGEAKFDQLARTLGYPQFISHEELLKKENGFLQKGTLVLQCTATYEMEDDSSIDDSDNEELAVVPLPATSSQIEDSPISELAISGPNLDLNANPEEDVILEIPKIPALVLPDRSRFLTTSKPKSYIVNQVIGGEMEESMPTDSSFKVKSILRFFGKKQGKYELQKSSRCKKNGGL